MINVGLIGCGYWGKNYVTTIEKMEELNISWIYNKHNEIPAQKLPVNVRFTKNYKDILADRNVQGVIISTPPGTHYQIAKDALEWGKDILVEKPFTYSSEEALRLLELAEKKGRIVMAGHIFLYNPAVVKLKRLIDRGELGKLYYFYSRRTGIGPFRTDINAMWNLAPHDISIINYLYNVEVPKAVSASGACFLTSGIEDVVDLVLEYENNVKAFIHVSWLEPKKARETIVVGDKKKAVFEDTSARKLALFDSDDLQSFFCPELEAISPLESQCLHFLECMTTGRQPLTDGFEGYKNVKLLESAQKSLKTGKKVAIDLSV